jgi:hypothetical protein
LPNASSLDLNLSVPFRKLTKFFQVPFALLDCDLPEAGIVSRIVIKVLIFRTESYVFDLIPALPVILDKFLVFLTQCPISKVDIEDCQI